MNTRSITFRLASWCAGISLLVCLGFGIYTYASLGYYLQRAQADTLQRRARQIAAIVAAHIGREGEAFTIDLIKTSYAPERNDRFIRIRRPDGSTLYVSGTPGDRSFNPARLAALTRARGRQGQPGIVTLGNLLLLQTEAPVGNGRYVIDCGASKLPSEQVLRGFLVTLGCGLPFIFVVAVTGGAMLVRHALVPVRRIIDGAKAITLYNVGQRLPVMQTKDELEHLSIVLNEMIERLHQAFQHSQRFLADASHELRTPLTIMRVELEGMSRDAGIPAALSWRIASVLEETERLASIVEGLFAISRLETGEGMINVTRVNLSRLVVTTVDQMMLLADEKGISVRCETGEPIEVSGDNFRLKQVVVNLLDNAIKYSQPGGEVSLRVHATEQEALLDIADRGPGMPPEALPHVFDRFFRADTVRTHSENGAGLGLSIVRSICLAHGGSVAAVNRPDGGCRLTVRLPLAGISAWPDSAGPAVPSRAAVLAAST